jgi:recombinational DNA repair protein (RecF pathway)
MPQTSHSGRGIAPFHDCDRCGYTYRVTELSRQLGLILCTYCRDNMLCYQRPQLITDVLSFTSDEELRIADILKENTSDDITSLSS